MAQEITDLITMVIHRSEWLTETHCRIGPHPRLDKLVDGDDLLNQQSFEVEYTVDDPELGKYQSTVHFIHTHKVTKRELLEKVIDAYHWLWVNSPCDSFEPTYDDFYDIRLMDGKFFGLECRGGVYRPIMVFDD